MQKEDLQFEGLEIWQDKSLYTFSSDSALLANFVKTKGRDLCLEVGTGSGVISVLLSKKQNQNKIVAIEMQKEMFALAQKNVLHNNLQNKIDVVNVRLQDFAYEKQFDVVFSNPPYFDKNTNTSPNDVVAKCRHECFLPIEELAQHCSKHLKFGGRLFLCYAASRVASLILALNRHGICVKKMCFIQPNQTKKPYLVLISATKGAKEDVKILPTLFADDEQILEKVNKLRDEK